MPWRRIGIFLDAKMGIFLDLAFSATPISRDGISIIAALGRSIRDYSIPAYTRALHYGSDAVGPPPPRAFPAWLNLIVFASVVGGSCRAPVAIPSCVGTIPTFISFPVEARLQTALHSVERTMRPLTRTPHPCTFPAGLYYLVFAAIVYNPAVHGNYVAVLSCCCRRVGRCHNIIALIKIQLNAFHWGYCGFTCVGPLV